MARSNATLSVVFSADDSMLAQNFSDVAPRSNR